MNVIFMGTPDFSVPTLKALLASRHRVIAVVTQPDRPKGRGGQLTMSPVKEAALAARIPVYQPQRAREQRFIEEMRALQPDVMVVIAFGQILTKELLEVPKYGCINIHASLLPKYRGAAPIQWAVINGDKKTGITTMMMDVGMDTGDMLETSKVELDGTETGQSLFERLSLLGGDLILSTLEKLEAGTLVRTPQDDAKATYVKKITKEMGEIDWSQSAVQIERLVRGLNPWPSAYTHFHGKIVKIWKAKVLSLAELSAQSAKAGQPSKDLALQEPFCQGEVLAALAGRLWVQTGEGVLEILELQLEGKKRLPAAEFLRGFSVAPGTVFGKEK